MKTIINGYLFLILFLIVSCKETEKKDTNTALETNPKKERLIAAVDAYVRGIQEKDFTLIPYADSATMRSPFTKEGMRVQLKGKTSLFNDWWSPLMLRPDSKEVVFNVVDFYFNESLTSIVAESVVSDYNTNPPTTVYVAERITVNEKGEIVDQINFIDVRDVLNPGWQEKVSH